VLTRIVFDSLGGDYEAGVSNYEDIYRFFLAEVQADAADVCDALYRLEHVFITLAPGADAQQVLESLNSTGAPLQDHELVHNYLLMGLPYDVQLEIERRTGSRSRSTRATLSTGSFATTSRNSVAVTTSSAASTVSTVYSSRSPRNHLPTRLARLPKS
jgi:hypothetical protein